MLSTSGASARNHQLVWWKFMAGGDTFAESLTSHSEQMHKSYEHSQVPLAYSPVASTFLSISTSAPTLPMPAIVSDEEDFLSCVLNAGENTTLSSLEQSSDAVSAFAYPALHMSVSPQATTDQTFFTQAGWSHRNTSNKIFNEYSELFYNGGVLLGRPGEREEQWGMVFSRVGLRAWNEAALAELDPLWTIEESDELSTSSSSDTYCQTYSSATYKGAEAQCKHPEHNERGWPASLKHLIQFLTATIGLGKQTVTPKVARSDSWAD